MSFDVREILGIVFKRKWFLILPVVIITAASIGGSFFLTPKYLSSAIIWIDKPSQVSRELTNIMGGNVRRQTREDRAQQLAALRNEIVSQDYLVQIIRELGLDSDPNITAQAASLREIQPSLSLEQLKLRILADALRKQISVSFVGADQIRLSVQSHDPVGARDLVNSLARVMEQERTKYELQRILDNQSFADLQLRKREFDYNQAIDSLTAAQSRLTQLQLPENISSVENRRAIHVGIDKAELDMRDYAQSAANLKAQLNQYGLKDARLKYSDKMVSLRTEIDGQTSLFANMITQYAWNEQNIINVNFRLNQNVRNLEDEVARGVDEQFVGSEATGRELLKAYFIAQENDDIASSRVTRLKEALADINGQINQIPKLEAEITELQQQVEDARRYRDAFRSEETTVGILTELAKDRTRYKIIEPPQVPLMPIWPDKQMLIIMAILLSFTVGGAAVVISEILDGSFRRVEDVEDSLGLKVLATVPKLEKFRILR